MLYQVITEKSYCYEESFEEAKKTAEILKKCGLTVEIKCLVPKKEVK